MEQLAGSRSPRRPASRSFGASGNTLVVGLTEDAHRVEWDLIEGWPSGSVGAEKGCWEKLDFSMIDPQRG